MGPFRKKKRRVRANTTNQVDEKKEEDFLDTCGLEALTGPICGGENLLTKMFSSDQNLKVDDQPDEEETTGTKEEEASSEQESAEPGEETPDADAQEEEDVIDMLANLDIPDFEFSVDDDDDENAEDQDDFDASAMEDSKATKKEVPWEDVDWNERLRREEVYSKRYKPNKEEREELEAMARLVGVANPNDLFGNMVMGSKATDELQKLFFGDHSILLSLLKIKFNRQESELLLMTEGFVIRSLNKRRSFSLLGDKKYEACHLWKDVDFCERVGLMTLLIQAESRVEIETSKDGKSLEEILRQVEKVVTQYHVFKDPNVSETLGWQYLRIRKPGFTTAITGDLKLLGDVTATINQLDHYNQYAPLHYAIQQEECNQEVIETLLQWGADPNLGDGDGRSAMYYAEMNEMPDFLEILKGGGGLQSELAEVEKRGELFSGVNEANENTEKRREQEQALKDQKAAEALAKAEGAQAEMNKAMAALVERGEKIEEMDIKAAELNSEAQNFAEMAAQLKEQVKGKKWYQL